MLGEIAAVQLPLLPLQGQSFVSRMSGCLLTAVGLE
jgi:predicted O-linked N-acetylglucosamine transferase (SPINDLY family)